MGSLVIIIGSATPPGRLHRVASEAVDWGRGAGGVVVDVIDLSTVSLDLADGRADDDYSAASKQAVGAVNDADGVVVFSPTYRASIPGVLKNMLDLIPVAGLQGKPVGIVAMGGSDHHYLGVDRHLRDIVTFFGAVAAPTSVYLTGSDFQDGAPVPAATEATHDLLHTVALLAERLAGARLRPEPLAAKAW